MSFVPARSPEAIIALQVVDDLQAQLVRAMERIDGRSFEPVRWLRDGGIHGGGVRYQAMDTAVFDRASVNTSQVHYDDMPGKRLRSATAISTILHPAHPMAPSMHMHISHTALRDGTATWRLMADLNPSHPTERHRAWFEEAIREVVGPRFAEGVEQGERYFFIPALGRHRGVSHFYLEAFNLGSFDEEVAFAIAFGRAVIDVYARILRDACSTAGPPTTPQRARQLAYHTLYFLQVLTLDRGTTSGLLIHDQNDEGILGSLPSHVDRALLQSWVPRLPEPQDRLLGALIDALPAGEPAPVTQAAKLRLAGVLREHYRAHPEALALQASGTIVPPTVENHLAPASP